MFRSSRMVQSEPNAAAKRRRIWIIALLLIVMSALSVAIVLGIQNQEDHALTAQITQTEADLRVMGTRIANIKDHEFKTMAEYVAAYAEIEPLLTAYDQKLQEYSELYNTAQQRDQKRGPINIRRLHNRYNPEIWRNTSELIALIRQINDVMKQEASVIRDMGSLRTLRVCAVLRHLDVCHCDICHPSRSLPRWHE